MRYRVNEQDAASVCDGLCAGGELPFQHPEQEWAAWQLYGMGLFRGVGRQPDGTPDFALDRTQTRAEAVTMLVRLLGHEEDAAGEHPFTDVPDWASRYVGYAYEAGLTRGVSATRFDASSTVTGAQFATFLLRALGYKSGTDFDWRAPWELAREIGLAEQAVDTTAISRRDAVELEVTALKTLRKGEEQTLTEQLIAQERVSRLDAWKSGVYPAITDEIYNNVFLQEKTLPRYQVTHTTVARDEEKAYVAFEDLPEEAVFMRQTVRLQRGAAAQKQDEELVREILFERARDWRKLDRADGVSNAAVLLAEPDVPAIACLDFFDADRNPIGYSIYKFSP